MTPSGFYSGEISPRMVCETGTSRRSSGGGGAGARRNDNQKPRPISKYIHGAYGGQPDMQRAVRLRHGARVSRKPAIIVHLCMTEVPWEGKVHGEGGSAFA